MAYANSTLLYGWSNDDAKNIIKRLFEGRNPSIISQSDLNKLFQKLDKDDNNGICKTINNKLKEVNIKLTFNIFEGGLSSDEYACYLHFGKSKTNQSCNGDDISEQSFTIKELKSFIQESFQFNKDYPGLTQPKLIHLTVADEK